MHEETLKLRVGFDVPVPPEVLQEADAMAEPLRLFPEEVDVSLERAEKLDAVGLKPTAPKLRVHGEGDEAAAERALQGLAAEHADDLAPLSAEAARAAAELTLAEYHAQHFAPWRATRLAAGTISKSTVSKENGDLRRYAEWDTHADRKPADWPSSVPWRGLPLRYLTAAWIKRFLLAKANGWAVATVNTCWTSLRTVLNHARDLGAIDKVPSIPRLKQAVRTVVDEDDDPTVLIYSDAQLGAIYQAFADVVDNAVRSRLIVCRSPKAVPATARAILEEIRMALVLGTNAGPRPADLFLLEFQRHVKLDRKPAELVFRAAKTGKLHRIPLAAVAVSHLDRLRKSQATFTELDTPVFPNLINASAKNPTESTAYRRTTKLLRLALTAVGIDESAYQKPWHSVRKSCTTRFNAHGIAGGLGSVGKLITHGKDADVASQSYDNPQPTIAKAVATIGWPAEFLV